jgi:hypothetical protein
MTQQYNLQTNNCVRVGESGVTHKEEKEENVKTENTQNKCLVENTRTHKPRKSGPNRLCNV